MGFRWISLLAMVGIFAALVPMALARPEGDEADRKEARAIGLAPPESPLERAREESGAGEPSPGRFDLPAGDLRVSPTQVLAARPGQRIRFTVTLDRRVPGATLHVTLPRRWTQTLPGRVPAIRRTVLRSRAGGRARLRRSGRDLALTFDDAADGATASFDVVDNGIPAGTWRLPFRWVDDATGQTTRAGRAEVAFLAPSRQGRDDDLFSPGPWRPSSRTTDSRNPRRSSQSRPATRTASRWGSTGPTRAWRRGSATTRARRGRRARSPRRSTPRATPARKREYLLRPDDGGRRPRQRLVWRPDPRPERPGARPHHRQPFRARVYQPAVADDRPAPAHQQPGQADDDRRQRAAEPNVRPSVRACGTRRAGAGSIS